MMLDNRFDLPLYTLAEAAGYLGLKGSTFRTWARSHTRSGDLPSRTLVTTVSSATPRSASVPFVGLAEGLVLAGIRQAGVPMQRIRPAIEALDAEFGIDHVLASQHLFTDGAEVLYNFAERSDDPEVARLVVVRTGQHVFTDVVQRYLKRIEFAADGYAQVIQLPAYSRARVFVDPKRGFGQPIFGHGGAKVEDVLGMFQAGESLETVSAEYGVPEDQLEDALRVATRQAA